MTLFSRVMKKRSLVNTFVVVVSLRSVGRSVRNNSFCFQPYIRCLQRQLPTDARSIPRWADPTRSSFLYFFFGFFRIFEICLIAKSVQYLKSIQIWNIFNLKSFQLENLLKIWNCFNSKYVQNSNLFNLKSIQNSNLFILKSVHNSILKSIHNSNLFKLKFVQNSICSILNLFKNSNLFNLII
jgi:hypothetical protein